MQDNHLQLLQSYIIAGWPETRDKLPKELKPYWAYRDELAVIDSIILKGKCIIVPYRLRKQVLEQLHTNHMGIEKTKLLAWESVYWHSINSNIEKFIKQCPTCLDFQQTQPKEQITHHNIPLRPWEVIGADISQFNNKNYICIVDYHSKFPIIKRIEEISADNLIDVLKIIFAEYGIPHKIMLDAGTNFISEKFQQFCKRVNIEQTISLLYHHQSNCQVEACIKFIKCMLKKCTESGRDIYMALLQICTMPLGLGLPSPATLLFNRQVRGIMPVLDCEPIEHDCDDKHHSRLVARQCYVRQYSL